MTKYNMEVIEQEVAKFLKMQFNKDVKKDDLEYEIIDDVVELNERLDLDLNSIEEYEYHETHFDTGTWMIFEGLFIRIEN
jgi:hypothetical protein